MCIHFNFNIEWVEIKIQMKHKIQKKAYNYRPIDKSRLLY